MATIVSDLPSDFVEYLIDPGLPVYDMDVPIQQYMCANASFGGNAEAELVIGYANQKCFVDEAAKTKISAQTRSIGRLTTGQGYPDDFILLMEHMVDNIDKMRAAPELRNKEYFASPLTTLGTLCKMVEKKVFGLDCIGFISQYLVYSEVWSEYKTYYPADYRKEFKPVKSLDDVERLCLLIWDNYHIAIVDNVVSYDGNELVIDVCQSSSGEAKGPQTNYSVSLVVTNDAYQGAQKFQFRRLGSPAMPVRHNCYICKMPGLVYDGDMWS